jgi:hypothetical protein
MRLETWTDAFGAAPSDLVETVLSLLPGVEDKHDGGVVGEDVWG